MYLTLEPKQPRELYPTDILFQSRYWSEVKARLGWKTYAFEIDFPRPDKDMLVIVKPFGPNSVAAYVPQGPEFVPDKEDYGAYLEAMSESVIEHVDADITFIRYDLPWESPYAIEMQQQNWCDFPESRIREMRMNFGTKYWNLKKAPVDVTVSSTCVIDLDGDEESFVSLMKPKTRYNVRLAERKGVRVHIAPVDKLPTFYQLYCQTAQRNGFHASEYHYFSTLFSAKEKQRSAPEILLLLATHKQDVLAGAIIALSEKRALFLHGASSNYKREFMAPYTLHWKAIQYARARQCSSYDMGAISPSDDSGHSFYGMYRFKTGFGGRIVHNCGSWDYPVKKDVYRNFRNWEMVLSQRERGMGVF